MKKAGKIILGIVAAIAIIVGIVFTMTAGMTNTAEEFFGEIKQRNYSNAYSFLAEDFRASTSESDFYAFLESSALLNFSETNWGARSISGGQGELQGSVVTDSGGVIPLTLGFVKENGSWKIYSLQKPRAGLVNDDRTRNLPATDELTRLVDNSMTALATAVNARDFTGFHSHVSNLWRKQSTPAEFAEIFVAFTDAEIDMLPPLRLHSPVFDVEPRIEDNGTLLLQGHYPTEPSRILFELQYIYEGLAWKLIGIDVNIVDP